MTRQAFNEYQIRNRVRRFARLISYPPPPTSHGAPGRSRTRNLMGRNHLLYPVELQGRRHHWGATMTLPRLGPLTISLCPTVEHFVAVLRALVVVAQLAERRDVAPEVAGSSPVGHPKGR